MVNKRDARTVTATAIIKYLLEHLFFSRERGMRHCELMPSLTLRLQTKCNLWGFFFSPPYSRNPGDSACSYLLIILCSTLQLCKNGPVFPASPHRLPCFWPAAPGTVLALSCVLLCTWAPLTRQIQKQPWLQEFQRLFRNLDETWFHGLFSHISTGSRVH